MKIIYHCYGGSHSSVTAASIHLGLLPEDRVPGREMFWNLQLFDRQEADQQGHIYFVGVDEHGHDIYLTARRNKPQILENVFAGLTEIFALPRQDYILVDAMHSVNSLMKLGGFLSRRWGLVSLGRPIVTIGTQIAYFRLVHLVQKVKGLIGEEDHENSVFQRHHVPTGSPGGSNSHRQAVKGKTAGKDPVRGPIVFGYQRAGRGNNLPGEGRCRK